MHAAQDPVQGPRRRQEAGALARGQVAVRRRAAQDVRRVPAVPRAQLPANALPTVSTFHIAIHLPSNRLLGFSDRVVKSRPRE